jgi:hypothetical protein
MDDHAPVAAAVNASLCKNICHGDFTIAWFPDAFYAVSS